MCEFKIIRKNNNSQIMEDVVMLYYNEDNELVLKDVIGMGETIESALILDVNTINQKCLILENPLIKDFVNLLVKLNDTTATKSDMDIIINQLEALKEEIPK
ncbi:MAG: CooT family nickel-binding protein [Candidatus Lokiarchaeota archaeon]|nr:CooT family nickel-binding protein [Candidatus Lokiarchaeota archaeon]